MTTTPTTPTPAPEEKGQDRPSGPDPQPRGHIGWIVAGSLATGLVAALLLVAAPFIPAEESAVTGAVLCGFALGWAMLAVLSVRFTDQPQRWAAAPALLMGFGGLLLVGFGSSAREVLNWVWPPAMLALAIWMIARVRRQLRSRSGHWLLYPVIALLALASIGGGYETVREATDATAYPMPGQLIDVGGHRLHLSCTGSGSPTVVLEPGAGEMSSNLGWITPTVARDTRVCVYDRAGRGWSEPADTAQNGAQIANDLHTLLQRGHVPGPYVLAGHSFGGLYMLTFAARYPDEVAGMVLVDSTAPASAARPGAASPYDGGSYDVLGRVSALVSTSARLGLSRLYGQLEHGSLPPRSGDEARASNATASHVRSTIDEYVQANASTEQAASLGDFAAKPLVVLTAGSGSDATHAAKQNHLATLSTNSVHRVIDGATHDSLISNQEDAAATTQAILDVVSSVRSPGPLDG
ncbi:alpha/beta hydrolase [Actinoplanes sp. NPDC051513]|uniref:alpha/beta hydrolase n=1 Tax=Actinoplanes sp. NPDC051513 TaxID=3363908 RepID=UPI00378DD5A2